MTNLFKFQHVTMHYALITLHGNYEFLVKFNTDKEKPLQVFRLVDTKTAFSKAVAMGWAFLAHWERPLPFTDNLSVYNFDSEPKYLVKSDEIYYISDEICTIKNGQFGVESAEILAKIYTQKTEINGVGINGTIWKASVYYTKKCGKQGKNVR